MASIQISKNNKKKPGLHGTGSACSRERRKHYNHSKSSKRTASTARAARAGRATSQEQKPTSPASVRRRRARTFAYSFGRALCALPQRFELGGSTQGAQRAAHKRSAREQTEATPAKTERRLASRVSLEITEKSYRKSSPNRSNDGPNMVPKWLPEASRSRPGSRNNKNDDLDTFWQPLGRLSSHSWLAPGGSWRRLGATWALCLPCIRHPGPPMLP